MTTPQFSDFALAASIESAVKSEGYHTPTPIQSRAIPSMLGGRDILATAQTGTGKTAAFVLPLIHKLMMDAWDRRTSANSGKDIWPEALILCPTRELAVQTGEAISRYGDGSNIGHTVIYGGASKKTQIHSLKARPHIVAATPGRLLDLISERHLTLKRVRYLILDEADRMLDMGFLPDVKRICEMIKGKHQTALFSATMPREIAGLASEIMTDPERISIDSRTITADHVDQSVLFVDQSDKLALLSELIQDNNMFRAIVFTRTKHRASRVAKALTKLRIKSDAIHGDKTQSARQRALEQFRSGRIQVLVATDVAARGIDVDDITHVVNFEIPNEPEMYIHRIGRTARAGAAGTAISFCSREEIKSLRAIERLIKSNISVNSSHGYHQEPPQQKKVSSPGNRKHRKKKPSKRRYYRP
jgi:ATP-dependent RNA helicase RhlE